MNVLQAAGAKEGNKLLIIDGQCPKGYRIASHWL
jgi:hypothetical protein